MAFGRVGAMLLAQGGGGTIPGFRFEAVILAKTEGYGFAKRPEKGGLVGRRPAEARGALVAVARTAKFSAELVVGHDCDDAGCSRRE